jgi:hypothetical protein
MDPRIPYKPYSHFAQHLLEIICIVLVGLAYHKEIKNMLMTTLTNPVSCYIEPFPG